MSIESSREEISEDYSKLKDFLDVAEANVSAGTSPGKCNFMHCSLGHTRVTDMGDYIKVIISKSGGSKLSEFNEFNLDQDGLISDRSPDGITIDQVLEALEGKTREQ